MFEIMMTDLAIKFGVSVGVLGLILALFAGPQAWLERKQSALMQDRVGANRATFTLPWGWAAPINWLLRKLGKLGVLNALADVIKLLTKEDFAPAGGDRFLHTLAPWISMVFAITAFAAIPFGPTVETATRSIPLQVANLNAGLLFLLALSSNGVYGVILAGMVSNNNFATLGGLRAASQMIAYEIALGISLVGTVMWFGSMDLNVIVQEQGRLLFGWLPQWGIFVQPLACLIFMTAGLAETKRVPFDLPEAEPEIVGYFTEYSGMKFGLFFLTDFVEVSLVSAVTATLFLGGWQVPYLTATGFEFPWGGAVAVSQAVFVTLSVLAFIIKVLAMIVFFMLVRWTFPRFRYDQLMHLGWKILFPLSVLNILVTGFVIVGLGL